MPVLKAATLTDNLRQSAKNGTDYEDRQYLSNEALLHIKFTNTGEIMSWKTINAMLGLATVDEDFCELLLADPVAAIKARQFEISAEELNAFKTISATNLSEFSQQLIALLDKDKK